jgi:hypothetical protein
MTEYHFTSSLATFLTQAYTDGQIQSLGDLQCDAMRAKILDLAARDAVLDGYGMILIHCLVHPEKQFHHEVRVLCTRNRHQCKQLAWPASPSTQTILLQLPAAMRTWIEDYICAPSPSTRASKAGSGDVIMDLDEGFVSLGPPVFASDMDPMRPLEPLFEDVLPAPTTGTGPDLFAGRLLAASTPPLPPPPTMPSVPTGPAMVRRPIANYLDQIVDVTLPSRVPVDTGYREVTAHWDIDVTPWPKRMTVVHRSLIIATEVLDGLGLRLDRLLGYGANGTTFFSCIYGECNVVAKIGLVAAEEYRIGKRMGDLSYGPKIYQAINVPFLFAYHRWDNYSLEPRHPQSTFVLDKALYDSGSLELRAADIIIMEHLEKTLARWLEEHHPDLNNRRFDDQAIDKLWELTQNMERIGFYHGD